VDDAILINMSSTRKTVTGHLLFLKYDKNRVRIYEQATVLSNTIM